MLRILIPKFVKCHEQQTTDKGRKRGVLGGHRLPRRQRARQLAAVHTTAEAVTAVTPPPATSRRIRHPESARWKAGDKPLNVQGEQKALQGMGCRSGFSTWRIWRGKGSKECSQLCRKKQERRVTAKSDLGQLALPDHGAPHHWLQETRYSQVRNIPGGTLRAADGWFNWTIKT